MVRFFDLHPPGCSLAPALLGSPPRGIGGAVPVMASCDKCERKFFLPTKCTRDVIEAQAYLDYRFPAHRCEEIDKSKP